MVQSTRKAFRALVLLMVVLSLALAACSSSAATTKPKNTPKPSQAVATEKASSDATEKASAEATEEASEEASEEPSSGGGDISDAATKLSAIQSYKFKMEMAGGPFSSLSMLSPDKNATTFTMTGTVLSKPEKAASVDMMGMKVIEVGGKTYINMLGSWMEDTSSSSSIADSFSPAKLFGSYTSFGYKPAGEGQKNGVTALHYTVDASEMKGYASMLDVEGDADWAVDLWLAKDGGYPVSLSLTAKQGNDYAFKFVMDITNVNDPANKVEKPI